MAVIEINRRFESAEAAEPVPGVILAGLGKSGGGRGIRNRTGTATGSGEEGFPCCSFYTCFACRDERCLVLNDTDFHGKPCPFYQTEKHVKKGRGDAFDRILIKGRIDLVNRYEEVLVDLGIHREFTSSYQAKFVIEKDQMYIENANRSTSTGVITPENLEPNPKNPIIASFFRNIGLADQLGSGIRNLFKYSRYYSGGDPVFEEGDIFRITVPLEELGESRPVNAQRNTQSLTQSDEAKERIVQMLTADSTLSQSQVAERLGLNVNTVKTYFRNLQKQGRIEREGTSRKGHWVVRT